MPRTKTTLTVDRRKLDEAVSSLAHPTLRPRLTWRCQSLYGPNACVVT